MGLPLRGDSKHDRCEWYVIQEIRHVPGGIGLLVQNDNGNVSYSNSNRLLDVLEQLRIAAVDFFHVF